MSLLDILHILYPYNYRNKYHFENTLLTEKITIISNDLEKKLKSNTLPKHQEIINNSKVDRKSIKGLNEKVSKLEQIVEEMINCKALTLIFRLPKLFQT